MRDVWDTKDGRRRVRVDLPTVEEARRAVLKMKRSGDDNRVTVPGRTGTLRAVVVERKPPRRVATPSVASLKRGRG